MIPVYMKRVYLLDMKKTSLSTVKTINLSLTPGLQVSHDVRGNCSPVIDKPFIDLLWGSEIISLLEYRTHKDSYKGIKTTNITAL